MSCVFLHVGQGGLGIARSFWQLALRDHQASQVSPFFSDDGSGVPRARCILVDTEPKVVRGLEEASHILPSSGEQIVSDVTSASVSSSQKSQSIFRKQNIFFEQYGRGNNWALGFRGKPPSRKFESLRYMKALAPSQRKTAVEVKLPEPQVESLENENSLLSKTIEAVRHEAERCDVFSGMMVTHSVSGGTDRFLPPMVSPTSVAPSTCLILSLRVVHTRATNLLRFGPVTRFRAQFQRRVSLIGAKFATTS